MTRSNALAVEASSAGADGAGLPRRFGTWWLIERLGSDPFGESYRAADAADGGRPLLLRLFGGERLEGEPFWRAMQGRRLGRAAEHPPLARRVGLGLTDGIPWAAYDCLPGRSLAQVLHRSRDRALPVRSEDALFIAERVGLALRAVHETRSEGRRITHGFLVPEHIWISADGEVRLLGVEAAAGFAALPAGADPRRAAAGYLAPEVAVGGAPERADDLYSLGAVLQLLLSGETPLPTSGDRGPLIEAATRKVEPSELRPEVDRLLREALAPRDERPTLEDWRQRLERVTFEGGRSPSTFRLAFHMHSLFGSDLEREAEPVAAPEPAAAEDSPPHLALPEPLPEPPASPPGAETVRLPVMTMPDEDAPFGSAGEEPDLPVLTVPTAADAALSVPTAAEAELTLPDVAEAALAPELAPAEPPITTDESVTEPEAPPAPEEPATAEATPVPFPSRRTFAAKPTRSSRWPLVGAVAALVLAALLATGYLLRDRLGWAAPPADQPASAAVARLTTAPAPPRAADPAADPATPEDIERQVGELVEERSDTLGSTIEEQYSSRLATLRREVETARQAAARERPAPPAAEPPPSASPPQAAPAPAPELPRPAQTAATGAAPPERGRTVPASDPSAAPAKDPSPAPSGLPAATVGDRQVATLVPTATVETPPTPAPEVVAARASPQQQSRPSEPAVRTGDLVEPGPDVVPPTLVRHPRPVYPPAAQRLRRAATVKLRVLVDENGEVAEVETVGPEVGLGFDAAALRAVRAARWQPAEKAGVKVRMWVDLSVAFQPE